MVTSVLRFTVCVAADVLAVAKLSLPAYCAVMGWSPTSSVAVLKVAAVDQRPGADDRGAIVEVDEAADRARPRRIVVATVAVKSTMSPMIDGLGNASVVAVAALPMV